MLDPGRPVVPRVLELRHEAGALIVHAHERGVEIGVRGAAKRRALGRAHGVADRLRGGALESAPEFAEERGQSAGREEPLPTAPRAGSPAARPTPP